MESSTSFIVTKDGFEVTLNKTDTELIIEAEYLENGRIYAEKFPNDKITIQEMTYELFESISELFEGLVTAFDETFEDTSVRVSPEGKLLFTQKVKIGKHEKVFNFSIPLKLLEIDPVDRLEKQMKKLYREVEQLRKENQKLKEKVNMIEDSEVLSSSFNPSSAFASYFDLSDDKKKATRNAVSNGTSLPILSSTILSKEINTKFQVKVNTFGGGYVTIGLGIQNIQSVQAYSAAGSYSICNTGNFCDNGTNKTIAHCSNFGKDSVVGVLFIPSKAIILFDIDGTLAYTAKLAEAHQNIDLYPFVVLSHHTSSVSFI